MVKINKLVPFILSALVLLAVVTPFAGQADAASYEPLTVPVVRDNEVSELGVIFARFTGGELKQNDTAIFRLPEGFIWTTAALRSDKTVASEAYQTTEEWNTRIFEDDYVRYGTSNYFLVPAQVNGDNNGLFKEFTPVLQLTRLNDREVKVRVAAEPVPFEDCYFYLYADRVFVAKGYRGNVSIDIDAPESSGFSGQAATGSTVTCRDITSVYAGVPGQETGTLIINEAAKGSLRDGQILKLILPEGARWVKLAEDSANGLKISGTISDDGRIAEFKFTGGSTAAATLTLEGMEVSVKAGVTGDLKVKVSGSAGLAGDLAVAKIINPAAVFTVGRTQFEVSGVENTMDVAPYIKDDRVYLPVRFIAQATGVSDNDIIWNQDERSVGITKGDRTVRLVVGSDTMYVNGEPVLMDAAPEIIEPGRTMLPLRWIAEALGYDVYWDGTAQKAFILDESKS